MGHPAVRPEGQTGDGGGHAGFIVRMGEDPQQVHLEALGPGAGGFRSARCLSPALGRHHEHGQQEQERERETEEDAGSGAGHDVEPVPKRPGRATRDASAPDQSPMRPMGPIGAMGAIGRTGVTG